MQPSRIASVLAALISVVGLVDLRSALQSSTPTGSGLIIGRIVDSRTGEPLRDAVVSLRHDADARIVDAVRTNRDGFFLFTGLTDGWWHLLPRKPGYGRDSASGYRVQLVDGQHATSVSVPMRKFGAIEGTVYDEYGEPMARVTVGLHLRSISPDWLATERAETDDRGRYRFYTLTGGKYAIGLAASEPHRLPGGGFKAYPAMYYPGAQAPSDAEVITLRDGDERTGVDFHWRPAGGASVSGQISGPTGHLGSLSVELYRAGLEEVRVNAARLSLASATTTTSADGTFEFPFVPSGQYVVRSLQRPAVPRTSDAEIPPTLWASASIVVGNEPVTEVQIPLRRGVRIRGRVEYDGVTARPSFDVLRRRPISVFAVDGPQYGYLSGRFEPGDTFTTQELPPGHFVVGVISVGNWKLRSIVIDGQDVTDTAVVVDAREIDDAVLTLVDELPVLRGRVQPSPNDVNEIQVVAFPAEAALWRDTPLVPRRMRTTAIVQGDEYVFDALPPGDYLLVALRDLPPFWRDDEFLQQLVPAATRVRVPERGVARQDLTVGPAGSTDQPAVWEPGPFVPDPQRVAHPPIETTAADGRIFGTVIDETGRAVRRASVRVDSTALDAPITTVSADAGEFLIDRLPPGRYRLTASKPAYLTTEYGARAPGRPGTSVTVGRGDVATPTMRLVRGGVVSGVITDRFGDPVEGATVRVLTLDASASGRAPRLKTPSGATPSGILPDDLDAFSDDRGRYRVYGLPAGRYLIGVTPGISGAGLPGRTITDAEVARALGRRSASDANVRSRAAAEPAQSPPQIAYGPTFYPGVQAIADALTVDVAQGSERPGLNVRLVTAPLVRVSGRVRTSDGAPPLDGRIRIHPDGPYIPTAHPGLSQTQTVRLGADGAFDIPSFVSGTYEFLAIGSGEWARVPVRVGDRDVSDLQVTLAPGVSVTGRVRFDGRARLPAAPDLQLTLAPQADAAFTPAPAAIRIGPDGSFSARGLIPGRYRLSAAGVPRPWFLRSTTTAGRELLDSPLDITPDWPDDAIEVIFSDQPNSLMGTFTDASGRPATDYFVIVFPTDRRYWSPGSRRIHAVRPATDGEYRVHHLPPGEYRLGAVWDVQPGEWLRADFLEQLRPGTIAVTIVDRQQTRQDIAVGGGKS